MKQLIKYFVTILVSILFFIIGDIAVQGAWLNRIDNPEFVISHKLGIDKSFPEIIVVKIIPENNLKVNNKIFEGLQIQLMDEDYKELQYATVKNGLACFDLSTVKKKHNTLYIISPTTGNELPIDPTIRNFEMQIDLTELKIKNKRFVTE